MKIVAVTGLVDVGALEVAHGLLDVVEGLAGHVLGRREAAELGAELALGDLVDVVEVGLRLERLYSRVTRCVSVPSRAVRGVFVASALCFARLVVSKECAPFSRTLGGLMQARADRPCDRAK